MQRLDSCNVESLITCLAGHLPSNLPICKYQCQKFKDCQFCILAKSTKETAMILFGRQPWNFWYSKVELRQATCVEAQDDKKTYAMVDSIFVVHRWQDYPHPLLWVTSTPRIFLALLGVVLRGRDIYIFQLLMKKWFYIWINKNKAL